MAAVLEAGRELLVEKPRTNAELRALLVPRWPEREPAALAYAVRGLLPVVPLMIEPFGTLPKEHRDAVTEEGERFARFIAEPEDAEAPEVRFVETT